MEHFTGMLRHWDRWYALGDGTCDDALNTPGCMYDMGDCCMPWLKSGTNGLKKSNGVCHMSGVHTPVGRKYSLACLFQASWENSRFKFKLLKKTSYASGWVENMFCMGERFTFQHSSECGYWPQNRQICNWSNGDCCTPYVKKFWVSVHEGARTGAGYCHFDWTFRNSSWIIQNQRYNFKKYYRLAEHNDSYFEIEDIDRLTWAALGENPLRAVLRDKIPIAWYNVTDRKRIVKPRDVLRKLDVNFCEEDKVREFDNMYQYVHYIPGHGDAY